MIMWEKARVVWCGIWSFHGGKDSSSFGFWRHVILCYKSDTAVSEFRDVSVFTLKMGRWYHTKHCTASQPSTTRLKSYGLFHYLVSMFGGRADKL